MAATSSSPQEGPVLAPSLVQFILLLPFRWPSRSSSCPMIYGVNHFPRILSNANSPLRYALLNIHNSNYKWRLFRQWHPFRATSLPLNGSLRSSDGPPIIIVPNAANTLLNIYNAKDFLENGNYVKWDEKASLSSLKPTNVGVMRNINRKEPYPHYQILNVAPKAGSKDW